MPNTIHTNVNDLMTMAVGEKIIVQNKVFTLEQQGKSVNFFLTYVDDRNNWRHVRDHHTGVCIFSRQELVTRLLSGHYQIN